MAGFVALIKRVVMNTTGLWLSFFNIVCLIFPQQSVRLISLCNRLSRSFLSRSNMSVARSDDTLVRARSYNHLLLLLNPCVILWDVADTVCDKNVCVWTFLGSNKHTHTKRAQTHHLCSQTLKRNKLITLVKANF